MPLVDTMTTPYINKLPYISVNDPVTTTPLTPTDIDNPFRPTSQEDINFALGLFPPDLVSKAQPKYYATSDIVKLDPSFANTEQIGKIYETASALNERDPDLFNRMFKAAMALIAVGGFSILFSAL